MTRRELHKSWGEKVRQRRQALGFSQDRLAELCGVRQATISFIENGRSAPNDDLKFVLAGALGETLERLFPYPPVVPPFPETVAS